MTRRPVGQPITYSPHERPPGHPGEVAYTQLRKVREWVYPDGAYLDGQYVERYDRCGYVYPAVLDLNGDLWIWRDSETKAAGWIRGSGWINHFEPGPEWQARCDHQHGAVWRPCTTERECDALAREETD